MKFNPSYISDIRSWHLHRTLCSCKAKYWQGPVETTEKSYGSLLIFCCFFIHYLCQQKLVSVRLYQEQGWEVTKYKYFVSVLKWRFQVSVLYFCIYFSDSVFLLLCAFHINIFLFLTFSKQANYVWLKTFEGSCCFTSLHAFKHQTDLSLNNNTGKAILMVYQSIACKEMKEANLCKLCIIYIAIVTG